MGNTVRLGMHIIRLYIIMSVNLVNLKKATIYYL